MGTLRKLISCPSSIAGDSSVPLGTIIGSHFGWTWTFGLVALLAGSAALALALSLPTLPTPPIASFRARIAPLGQGRILLGLCLTFFWALAGFTIYTYITPLLRENMHLGEVSGLLLIYGLASMVGNWVGGYAVDRWGAFRSILISLVVLVLTFLTLPFTTHFFFGAAIALAVWGVAAWSLYPAQQHRLLALAPAHSSVILALNGSVLYLGIAAGAGIGGLILAYTSVSMLGVVAGIAEALALGTLLLSVVRSSASVAPLSAPVEEPLKAKSLR